MGKKYKEFLCSHERVKPLRDCHLWILEVGVAYIGSLCYMHVVKLPKYQPSMFLT